MMKFRMVKITVDQFAILSNEAPTGDLDINIEIGMKYAAAARRIMPTLSFSFEKEGTKLLLLQMNCEFEIAPDDWEAATADGKVKITKPTLECLVAQTVGASRGIMHCKTEGTLFNGVILPPVNVARFITEDMVCDAN